MAHFSKNSLIVFIRRLLNIFGLWPGSAMHCLYHVYSYNLHIVVSLAYTVFQTVNLVKSVDNVNRFTESIYSGVTVIAYLLKLINFMYYEKHLINCLAKLTHMQENNRSNETIVREKLAGLSKITTVFFFGAHCTVLAAALKSILSETPVLPIESWYPLDWQHSSRDFWIVFAHDTFGAFIVGQVNLGMDSYAFYLMAMITAQFEMLYVHIEQLGMNIVGIDPTKPSYKKEVSENNFSLNLCLKEHRLILELVADVERYFSMQFFVQICLSGTVLACGVHHLNGISPTENFFQFTYLLAFMVTVTLQTFLGIYFAHGILQASESLSTALYSSHWYKLLPDLGKPLMILMERLRRKSEILAGKVFRLNLPLFATIMDLTYRLYILLQSS